MTVNTPKPTGPRPALWRGIADALQRDIHRNVFKAGERLPTEQALVARFGVNRHTVRRAIAALAEEGVLRAEQGRGTFVQSGRIDYPITRRTRFSASMRAQEREAQGTALETREQPADAKTAAALGIAAGSPVAFIELVRLTDGMPVAIGAHYFSLRRLPAILSDFADSGSITAALEAAGVGDYVRGRTQVSARLPTVSEARTLQVARTKPLLVTESVNLDRQGEPVEFGIARFPADRVQLVFEP